MADVPAVASLAAMANPSSHVVLRFPPSTAPEDKSALIGRLSSSLADHAVFDSGGDQKSTWVTVMSVVSRTRVIERRSEVLQAIRSYRETCDCLVREYRVKTLSKEWKTDEHGGHCRFENRRTGQVVEAPYNEWAKPDRIDPYFFSEFVKTTSGFEAVAELIDHNFHDGARILEVVIEQAAEPKVAPDCGGIN
jgi:hypothetical protein